jgi:hypothetical protein
MPPSFQDDTIARRQLSYVPSRRAKSAFLGNDSTINRVCHSESKINHALIDGQYKVSFWMVFHTVERRAILLETLVY